MDITAETTVAEIATTVPATIRVFQAHHIDFCCGGKIPLADACAVHRLEVGDLLEELRSAGTPAAAPSDWRSTSLTSLIDHIQATYHQPLRLELRRLEAMLTKVVERHGAHLPQTLLPLHETFTALQVELLDHMAREDRVLFPWIATLESPAVDAAMREHARAVLAGPIAAMEDDHERAGHALATMRTVTDGYTPPEWACPTFRGLYFGLAQFEADMHVHVHLENHILFPRAIELARR